MMDSREYFMEPVSPRHYATSTKQYHATYPHRIYQYSMNHVSRTEEAQGIDVLYIALLNAML